MVELLELMGCAVQVFKQFRLGLTPCHRAGFDLRKWLWLVVGRGCAGRGVRRGGGWVWANSGNLSALFSFRPPAVLGFVMVHRTYTALKLE